MTAVLSPQMLNLGCGHRFHPDWVNVDIVPRHPGVIRCDLSQGIPFSDHHFDVVYHSHMLEHIRRADVPAFLRDCHRVLRPGGILRIATPDLERLCELYLHKLRSAAVDARAEDDLDWLVIEMYDQTVREQSGGEMLGYLQRDPLPNEAFVLERIGQEGRELLALIRAAVPAAPPAPQAGLTRRVIRGVRRRVHRLPGRGREALVKSWYGDDALQAMSIGRFRLSGEVHQWMYDRVSLSRALSAAGFSDPTVRTATESAIPGWSEFRLDSTPAGDVTKPDSFFMEARKSARP
jgi:SAM-dependent methyltransferase